MGSECRRPGSGDVNVYLDAGKHKHLRNSLHRKISLSVTKSLTNYNVNSFFVKMRILNPNGVRFENKSKQWKISMRSFIKFGSTHIVPRPLE